VTRRSQAAAMTASAVKTTVAGGRDTTAPRAHTSAACTGLPGDATGEDPDRERRRGVDSVSLLGSGWWCGRDV